MLLEALPTRFPGLLDGLYNNSVPYCVSPVSKEKLCQEVSYGLRKSEETLNMWLPMWFQQTGQLQGT